MTPRHYSNPSKRNWKCNTVPSIMSLWKSAIVTFVITASRFGYVLTTNITTTTVITNNSDSSSTTTILPSTLDQTSSTILASQTQTILTSSSSSLTSSSDTSLLSSVSLPSTDNSTALSTTSYSNSTTTLSTTSAPITTSLTTGTSSFAPQTLSVTNATSSLPVTLESNATTLAPASSVSNATSSLPVSLQSNATTLSPAPSVTNATSLSPVTLESNATTLATVSSFSNATSSLPVSLQSNATTLAPASSVSNATSSLPVTLQSNSTTITPASSVTNATSSLPVTLESNATTLTPASSVTNSTSSLPVSLQSNSTTITPASSVTNTTSLSPVTLESNATTLTPVSSVTNSTSSLPVSLQSNATTLTPASSVTNSTSSLPVSLQSNATTLTTGSNSSASTLSSTQSVSSATTLLTAPLNTSTTESSLSSTVSNASTSSQTTNTTSLPTSSVSSASTLLVTTSTNVSTLSTGTTSSLVTLNSNVTTSSLATSVSTTINTNSTSTMQTTTASPTATVPLEFKIVNRVFNDTLKNESSDEYKTLKKNVEVEMTAVYKAKFKNFKKVTVTGFSPGSVIVTSVLEFENTTAPAPSSDNTVRALISSLQSNGSVGVFQLQPESISSNNISQLTLPPNNISVNFLIVAPYNESANEALRTQTITWVQDVLLVHLNGTVAAQPKITFSNNGGWTYTTAYFAINSTNLLNETTVLNNLITARKNAGFSIVPGTLMVQGTNLTFNIISLSLGVLNLSPSSDLTVKSSSAFQTNATAIANSFKDIFGQQPEDVEPVVNTFINDPLPVTAPVDLYFLNVPINKTTVVKRIISNRTTFINRNTVLDLFSLDSTAIVEVKFTLIQNYTSSMSNMSSSDTLSLQNSLLNLLTPNLETQYSNGLEVPPSVTFQNVDGPAATVVQYVRNRTENVGSAQVIKSLQQNSGLKSLIRIASLKVNNVKDNLDVFTYYPRFTNLVYSSDLKDRNSQTFKKLEQNVINGLGSILTNFNLAQTVVDSFMQGSVISKVELVFPQGTTTPTTVAQQIVNNQNILQNYDLTLDPQSVYVTPTAPPAESYFPGYAVAIIVMCILAILCIPVFVILSLKTDMCLKLRRAFALKPPYQHIDGTSFMPSITNYRTHAYELPH